MALFKLLLPYIYRSSPTEYVLLLEKLSTLIKEFYTKQVYFVKKRKEKGRERKEEEEKRLLIFNMFVTSIYATNNYPCA